MAMSLSPSVLLFGLAFRSFECFPRGVKKILKKCIFQLAPKASQFFYSRFSILGIVLYVNRVLRTVKERRRTHQRVNFEALAPKHVWLLRWLSKPTAPW